MTLFERVAAFLRTLDAEPLPARLTSKLKAHLLDTLGLTVAAASHPNVRRARAFAAPERERAETVEWERGREGAPEPLRGEALAFVAGVAADALGLDDFDERTRTHPGAVLLPALLGAASIYPVTGERLVRGALAGYELICRLGEAGESASLHRRGFHPTAVWGVLGAAAAVTRATGGSAADGAAALGLAASLASGIFELDPEGAVKGLQVGWAARNGLVAARLARAGYRPAPSVLDGPQGMLRAFRGAAPGDGADGGTAGERFAAAFDRLPRLERISFKPYAHFTDLHPATAALIALLKERPLPPDQVTAVRVRLHESAGPRLNPVFPPPSPKQARRCPRFALAAVLHRYRPGNEHDPFLDAFGPAALADRSILATAGRIEWAADLTAADGATEATAVVELRDRNGLTRVARAEGYPGDGRLAARRWGWAEAEARFRLLTRELLPAEGADRLVSAVRRLEEGGEVRELVALVVRLLVGRKEGEIRLRNEHWSQLMLESLAAEKLSFLPYLPDGALAPLIDGARRRPEFELIPVTREEEGVGLLTGITLAGRRGALLMQTSGMGNSLNAIGSLNMAQRIPLLLIVTERGGLGETVLTQIPFGHALRRVLETLGIHCFEVSDRERIPATVAGGARLAYTSRVPVVLLLTAFLLGGEKG